MKEEFIRLLGVMKMDTMLDINMEDENNIVFVNAHFITNLYPELVAHMGIETALQIVNGDVIYNTPLEQINKLYLNLHLIYQDNLFTFRQMFGAQGAYPTDDDVRSAIKQKLVKRECSFQNKQFETCDYPLESEEQIEARVENVMQHLETIKYREELRWAVHETSYVDRVMCDYYPEEEPKKQGMHC